MRTQSATYAPFASVRRCDFRATLRVEAVGARDGATATTSNGGGSIAIDDLKGWTSNEVTGAGGVFATPPFIYITLPEDINSIGTTVQFIGPHATSIRVTAYAADGATFINRGTFPNNGRTAAMSFTANGYRYLKIEFLSMSAVNVPVVLDDVVFGLLKVYEKDSIQRATIINKAGFAGETLPSQQLTLVVDNSDKSYDVLNPKGIYTYLEDGQPIDVECLINDEAVFMGTYYFQSASTPNSSLLTTIKATDKILPLSYDTFTGGRAGTSSLTSMVSEVLEGTGIQADFETGLASAVVSCAIPAGTNKREALRLLAQAAKCSCWCNRDGVLYFGRLELEFPGRRVFTHDDLDNLGGFSVEERVDAVHLSVYDSYNDTDTLYTCGDGANIKMINNPCVVDGDAVAEWLHSCYLRRRRYKMPNRGDPALEIGDTIMIYDPYTQDFYATITGITLNYNGGISITTEGVGPGKPTMVFPYYSGEIFSGEMLNA